MNLLPAGDGQVISRLRLRGRCADPLLARLRASAALASVTLAPAGLSPAAVLLVRRLRDPLPGRVAVHASGMRPPGEWEHALRRQMETFARRAQRPAREAVAEDAEAVLFTDQSELLACLTRDWVRGASSRWWWRTLFGDRDLAAVVRRAWLDRPQLAPAAIADLARSGDHVRWAAHLESDGAIALLQSIAELHGLSELRGVLAAVLEGGRPTSIAAPAESGTMGASARRPTSLGHDAPWSGLLDRGSVALLTAPQEALLGVGLAIVHMPAAVRSRSFAQRVRAWAAWQSSSLGEQAFAAADEAPESEQPLPAQREATIEGSGDRPATSDPRGPDREVGTGESRPATASTADLASTAHPDVTIREAPIEAHREPLPLATTQLIEDRAIPETIEASTATSFGGLLFLVNLGLFLELYGDFTNPRRPGIELSIWDFVALVGENLLGPRMHSDPLWSLLGMLAGRSPDQRPGRNFRPPGDWRIPPAWLRGLAWWPRLCASAADDRLRVETTDRLMLLDVALRGRLPAARLVAELRPYIETGLVSRAAVQGLRRSLPRCSVRARRCGSQASVRRWCAWLFPFLRLRLCNALGVGRSDGLARALLELPAQVHLTATRLDVRFPLSALPIAVRLSGLDRDPGWVPAAGRSVHFHFD